MNLIVLVGQQLWIQGTAAREWEHRYSGELCIGDVRLLVQVRTWRPWIEHAYREDPVIELEDGLQTFSLENGVLVVTEGTG